MSKTAESTRVSLPDDLVAEIEAIHAKVDLDAFVHQAVQTYIAIVRHRQRHKKLAQDCAGLSDSYDELPTDLAEEVWLCLEKDARSCKDKAGQARSFSEN